MLIEPIQGEGGFIVPATGFLPAISAWCTDNGALLIADEIQTGFCRTGAWFACDHEGVVPDLITLAKGIAGGLPLAAVTGRAEIMDAVHSGGLGGTYGGNPVACAAALGAIETMRELDLVGAAQAIETTMMQRLSAMQARHDVIGDIRGRGAMIAMELVKPGTTEPNPALAGADRQGLPCRGCRRADGGYLRQRVALPAAAGDPAGPAVRGSRRAGARGRHAGVLILASCM